MSKIYSQHIPVMANLPVYMSLCDQIEKQFSPSELEAAVGQLGGELANMVPANALMPSMVLKVVRHFIRTEKLHELLEALHGINQGFPPESLVEELVKILEEVN